MKDLRKFIATTIREYLNENRITKKVYRGGSEIGSSHHSNVTYYTDSDIEAKNYANYFHDNDKVYSKVIDFKNPLILVKSEIGHKGLHDMFIKIFDDGNIPDIYEFPFNINDSHRNKIIDYARNNGYDGIIKDDSDISGRNRIRSYIEI